MFLCKEFVVPFGERSNFFMIITLPYIKLFVIHTFRCNNLFLRNISGLVIEIRPESSTKKSHFSNIALTPKPINPKSVTF